MNNMTESKEEIEKLKTENIKLTLKRDNLKILVNQYIDLAERHNNLIDHYNALLLLKEETEKPVETITLSFRKKD